jgi:NAD+ dependent glucose-6-phosphate dehydrogenase
MIIITMKIAITGAKGTIGQILSKGLAEHNLTLLDLPENNLLNYESALETIAGNELLIHLAWDTENENINSSKIDQKNTTMYENVLRAALECGVKKLVLASSVHVNDYESWNKNDLITIDTKLAPITAYGTHKLQMEELGRKYAGKGLEIVCVRFGGIPLKRDYYKDLLVVGLTHSDCTNMFKKIIETEITPRRFSVFYAVSNNSKRVHDFSNPFNWKPQQDAAEFYNLR